MSEVTPIGREISLATHLSDGQELQLAPKLLIEHGRKVFMANWTIQEGGGRPMTKGTGAPLGDTSQPLVFPRNFNRISAPDANSCAGCHNVPRPGGSGDIVANVFVLGQRFDFATFGEGTSGSAIDRLDETGAAVTLQTIANSRATLGMFGSGYIEMVARQMTADLQRQRDSLSPGASVELVTKGVSFGILAQKPDGSWDVSGVIGLPAPSLQTGGPSDPPNLVIRPFHQVGNVVSLRQFSNNAFNHHHGMQAAERFGRDVDPDGDGFVNELTRADITAVSLFQATLPVPGRVIPNNPTIEQAVLIGEAKFQEIGCATCHVPSLPLNQQGWVFSEPNPYNPSGNLRPTDGVAPVQVDLSAKDLPSPRLPIFSDQTVYVPAFTDLRLHDICLDENDPNVEGLDMNQPPGSEGFFGGNRLFLTRKLWDVANKPNYFHHGQFTTMRQAILAHAGEAMESRLAFEGLSDRDRDCVIEFLKTLRVLPEGTPALFVDEFGQPKVWPPVRLTGIARTGNQLRIFWSGSNGVYHLEQDYKVETTDDLGSGTWRSLGLPLGETSLTVSADQERGFFRVQAVPR